MHQEKQSVLTVGNSAAHTAQVPAKLLPHTFHLQNQIIILSQINVVYECIIFFPTLLQSKYQYDLTNNQSSNTTLQLLIRTHARPAMKTHIVLDKSKLKQTHTQPAVKTLVAFGQPRINTQK